MKRFLKWFAVLTFLALIATTISYMGMRLRVGQLVGDAKTEFVGRRISFGKDSIPRMGERTAWTVTWDAVRLPGVRRATIWVSPGGKIIATDPADLDDRVAAFLRTRDPS